MGIFEIVTILVVLAAALSFLNHRFIGLPTTIGVMLLAMTISLVLIGLGHLGVGLDRLAGEFLARVQFKNALLHGMLAFLLFAGALHVNLGSLARQKWVIATLATLGVLMSTALVGLAVHVLFGWLGFGVGLLACLLFGALITPTDPIAVLGIMKKAGAPRSLETKICGESLFNDGVGVVVFLALLHLATEEHGANGLDIAQLFLVEVGGGLLLGLGAGLAGFWILKHVDEYQVEVLISLAVVMGSYAMAGALHASGPIAVVVAGLMIGNHGRMLAMSDRTREHLDTFWELIDEILNVVLFVMIGLEILVVRLDPRFVLAGILVIPIVLAARLTSVSGTVFVLRRRRRFSKGAIPIMTWAGLRGGLSVAMVLSLPQGPDRSLLLTVTYCVVVFSIVVQGLSVGPLIRRYRTASTGAAD